MRKATRADAEILLDVPEFQRKVRRSGPGTARLVVPVALHKQQP